MKKRCDQCKWAILWDYGYSNYTTEGTNLICAQRCHPEGKEFDRFYGNDKRLLYANQCEHYGEGAPIEIDVEQEALHNWRRDFTDEQRATWELHLTFELLEDAR